MHGNAGEHDEAKAKAMYAKSASAAAAAAAEVEGAAGTAQLEAQTAQQEQTSKHLQVWTYIGVGPLDEYHRWNRRLARRSAAEADDEAPAGRAHPRNESVQTGEEDPGEVADDTSVGAPPLRWVLSDINGIVHGPSPDFI
jgi:hypothetical protein